MSIINEALKKLQTQISSSQTSTIDARSAHLASAQQAGYDAMAPSPIPPSHQPSEKDAGSALVIILGLLCLLIALFAPVVNKQSLIGMLWTKIPQRSKSAVVKTIVTAPAPPASVQKAPSSPVPDRAQPPIKQVVKNLTASVSKAPANSSSRLIINGVMSRGEDNLVLIDGQVYEEGDEVDGIKLLKITPKGVVVLENGIERTVKVMGQ